MFAVTVAALLAPPAPPPVYRAGTGVADITPGHPIRLNGFGYRRAESEGVYQSIKARALALDTGDGHPAVLVVVDVLGIPADYHTELARRLKRAGVRPERLAVMGTHTHTGPMLRGANPTLFGVPIPPEHQANIDKYAPVFLDRLEAAALAAIHDLKPAKLSFGVGTVRFAANRRARGGPNDHDLPMLFVTDPGGRVRAVYTAYACHAVTLSLNKLGGDWPGYAAAAVETDLPGAVALVAAGCGADQNPTSGVTGDKLAVAAEQGRELAAEVRRLAGQFRTPVTGPLVAKTQSLTLLLAPLPARTDWEEKAKRADAIGHHARVNLARLDRGEKLPTSVAYPVQTWAFGESLAMAHLPGEVVVDYATRLKRELDAGRVWVTAYANAAPGYVPSERVLTEGGYEGGGAMVYYDLPGPFAPGLEAKIVAEVRTQLGPAFAARFDPAKTGGTRPLSPQQSLAAIRVGPGLAVDLVAAEPLVRDPVAFTFGPDGKVWVAEMGDYPLGKNGKFDPGGRVVVLEDTRGTGRIDKSTVFLDGLPFPTGVLPWRNGVLVCAAPDILFAEDIDGDGRADRVTKLFSGFGTENYQGRVNGLQYGLDGWVYGSCGLFGGRITCHMTGKTVALGDRDFRVNPDTGELEPATGRTQQGRVRNDAGDWFGCDNSTLIRHYALEDHYLRRNPHAEPVNAAVNVVAGPDANRLFPLVAAQRFALSGPPGNVTAACGLGVYRDDLLGNTFSGNAFTCEPVNLAVHRLSLMPKGIAYTGTKPPDEAGREFIASTDGWFRPVMAATGPDGGLWVADMYRFLIEHPRWIPAADMAKIDPRAGAGLGRLYRVRPTDKPLRPWPRLDQLDANGLVASLDTPNGWQRDMATQLLVWKADPAAVVPLETLLRDSLRPLARVHALCTLAQLGRLRPEIAAKASADPDAVVRRHAARLAPPAAASKLADDPDAMVRLFAAYALGNWPGGRAGGLLAGLARRYADDPLFAAAVASSLNADTLPGYTAALLDPAANTDPPPRAVRDLVATAAGMNNAEVFAAVLTAVAKPTAAGYRPWHFAAAAAALDRRADPAALAPLLTAARVIATDSNAPAADLLAALPLLRGRDDVPRLAALLAPSRPVTVQAAAVATLSRSTEAAVSPALIAAWAAATPDLRIRLLDSLLARPAWQAALVAAAEVGTIPPGQIDAGRRQRLLAHPDAVVRGRAEKLFAGGVRPDRQKVLADYEPVLSRRGDRERGKAVFAVTCAPCHALGGVGSAVGPDLAALADKSPRYLIGEILDPNRALDSRYAEYQAHLADGRVVVGVLASESATGLTLRGQGGKEETVLRADLESLRGGTKSLMPEGLEKDLPTTAMADLLAFLLVHDPPPKRLPGNTPAEITAIDGRLTLPAAKAFVYGGQIVFEPEFANLGYWSGANDLAVWRVNIPTSLAFDVYLDYSCAADSEGNPFVLDGADPTLRGTAASTGTWDHYALRKLGALKLPTGPGRLAVRPTAPVRGALFDLRAVYLVPVGTAPRAADVIRVLTTDLPSGADEYRRIPAIWQTAFAAGRVNDATTLRELLAVSLPPKGGRMRDWQAVALGGGIVNGLSRENVWPGRRVGELMKDQAELAERWAGAVTAALTMADTESVTAGTRYDALRMVALGDWSAARPRLTKYLGKESHPELQQGAVSGLADVERDEVGPLLVSALPGLTDANRVLAVAALARTPARAAALFDALSAGKAKPEWLTKEARAVLLAHPDDATRLRAKAAFGK